MITRNEKSIIKDRCKSKRELENKILSNKSFERIIERAERRKELPEETLHIENWDPTMSRQDFLQVIWEMLITRKQGNPFQIDIRRI